MKEVEIEKTVNVAEEGIVEGWKHGSGDTPLAAEYPLIEAVETPTQNFQTIYELYCLSYVFTKISYLQTTHSYNLVSYPNVLVSPHAAIH